MRTRRWAVLAGAALGAGSAALSYRRTMAAAWARVKSGSAVIPTRAGAMEYAETGCGPAVMVIHGTGGGFDQGLLFARPIARAGFRVIVPSRFGYLRSDFPKDASSEAQADAFIDLLDHLGIERVSVLGASAGALPALAFAIRHPDRCAALLPIVPATHVPGRPPQPVSPTAAFIMEWGLKSDLVFWAGMRMAEDRMIKTLLATDPALVHTASPEERARVREILRSILPVSARARGLLNDARLAGDPAPMDLVSIRAPTLAISVEDDRFGTAAAARHIAASVPGARLLVLPDGGHVWIGHDREMLDAVTGFLRGA